MLHEKSWPLYSCPKFCFQILRCQLRKIWLYFPQNFKDTVEEFNLKSISECAKNCNNSYSNDLICWKKVIKYCYAKSAKYLRTKKYVNPCYFWIHIWENVMTSIWTFVSSLNPNHRCIFLKYLLITNIKHPPSNIFYMYVKIWLSVEILKKAFALVMPRMTWFKFYAFCIIITYIHSTYI